MKSVTNNAELKFTLHVGRLNLNWVISTLKKYCNHYAYDCFIEKGLGILRVPLFVRIRLPYDDGKLVETELKEIFN